MSKLLQKKRKRTEIDIEVRQSKRGKATAYFEPVHFAQLA